MKIKLYKKFSKLFVFNYIIIKNFYDFFIIFIKIII